MPVADQDLSNDVFPYYTFREDVSIAGIPVFMTRLGYTAELGYELWVDRARALDLWDALVDAGAASGMRLIGMTALQRYGLDAIRILPFSMLVLLAWCVASALWAPESTIVLRRAGLEVVVVVSLFLSVEILGAERAFLIWSMNCTSRFFHSSQGRVHHCSPVARRCHSSSSAAAHGKAQATSSPAMQ